jgi:hypothetical protein
MQNLCIDDNVMYHSTVPEVLRQVQHPFYRLPVLSCVAENEAWKNDELMESRGIRAVIARVSNSISDIRGLYI